MPVDYNYYLNEYFGGSIPPEEFPRYRARSEDLISALTGENAHEENPHLSADSRRALCSAVCAQIEYYAMMGLTSVLSGTAGQPFTVGNVSVGGRSGRYVGLSSFASPAALFILESAGLLYRGICAKC